MLAFTFPLGPTVKLWFRKSMLPSTSPSTYRSSDPDTSPLITTDLPILASSLVCGASIDCPHFLALCRIANPLIVNHRAASRRVRPRDIIETSRTWKVANAHSKATFDLLPSSNRSEFAQSHPANRSRHLACDCLDCPATGHNFRPVPICFDIP